MSNKKHNKHAITILLESLTLYDGDEDEPDISYEPDYAYNGTWTRNRQGKGIPNAYAISQIVKRITEFESETQTLYGEMQIFEEGVKVSKVFNEADRIISQFKITNIKI